MSNKITNICRPLRIRPTPKCVLMALADRGDDDGVAWPSIAWLSEWTCFSRRAVMNALDELEGAGLVRISKVAGKNSRCEIVLHKIADEVANPGTTCTGTRAGGAPVGGEENGADPCTSCTSAGSAPVQEVHTHPGTTCTGTRAGGAHGGAGGAPDTSIDTLNTSRKTNTDCTEPLGGVVADVSPPVALIPLVNGSEHPVTQADVEEWERAFPSVDVVAQLLKARLWCRDNPTRRKTARGVRKFLTGWLGREQDRGREFAGQRRQDAPRQSSRHGGFDDDYYADIPDDGTIPA